MGSKRIGRPDLGGSQDSFNLMMRSRAADRIFAGSLPRLGGASSARIASLGRDVSPPGLAVPWRGHVHGEVLCTVHGMGAGRPRHRAADKIHESEIPTEGDVERPTPASLCAPPYSEYVPPSSVDDDI